MSNPKRRTITVRSHIPVDPENQFSFITFQQWAPIRPRDALILQRQDLSLRVWFDRDCVWPPDLEDIDNRINVGVRRVNVDVTAKAVEAPLVDFIYSERSRSKREATKNPDGQDATLNSQYKELGEQIFEATIEAFNRLISYFRAHKGQYWLRERPVDTGLKESHLIEFRSKVRSSRRPWVTWRPPLQDHIVIYDHGRTRYLTRQEWRDVERFMTRSSRRANFVLELLANAELLLEIGHTRSAIIESVSALEVATAKFAKAPKIESLDYPRLKKTNLSNLKNLMVKHLGLHASIQFLLPYFLPESVWPTQVRGRCFQALSLRGQVVHRGQREVKDSRVRPLVSSVRKTCEILLSYTEEDDLEE